MVLRTQKWITRKDLRENPTSLYIFGDNMARVGLGGQAKEMRGEPNAIGIATKRSPQIYFADRPDEFLEVANDFQRILEAIDSGDYNEIVWPEDGIGTGLARLEEKSPGILLEIEAFLENLGDIL